MRAVETGCCPHTAIRDDISANLEAIEDLERRLPPLDLILVESGGDNLTATFSRGLVHHQIFVVDVAGGDKVPRKGGPGVTGADLLVINKTDLAAQVGADLSVMARDAAGSSEESLPVLFTSLTDDPAPPTSRRGCVIEWRRSTRPDARPGPAGCCPRPEPRVEPHQDHLRCAPTLRWCCDRPSQPAGNRSPLEPARSNDRPGGAHGCGGRTPRR